jgi:formylglycine-generating enzyme required for sulfatase activity
MSDIFISYKREEQSIAKKLAEALEKKGWSVWWDPKLRAGEHFDDAIERALTDAKCVIVMWSKLSVNSRYVKDEATYALNRNKLVPIQIEEVDLPFRFEGIQTGQLINWDGSVSSPGFQKLVVDIASTTGDQLFEAKERKPKQQQVNRKLTKKSILRKNEEEQKHEEVPKKYANSIGMKFVLIPTGQFVMGSKVKRYYIIIPRKVERPLHTVKISQPFYLQTSPVTKGQWQKVMGYNPSVWISLGDNFPVEKVSWYDTQKFIKKLNEIESTNKYRLPTEAEWEYACRAGTTTHFSFGDDDKEEICEYAWVLRNSDKTLHPVETKKPNPWGLYDMHGNVREWVEDDWHGDYEMAPTDGSAWIEEPRGTKRVVRSGHYEEIGDCSRSSHRGYLWPDVSSGNLGFRIARSVSFNL